MISEFMPKLFWLICFLSLLCIALALLGFRQYVWFVGAGLMLGLILYFIWKADWK